MTPRRHATARTARTTTTAAAVAGALALGTLLAATPADAVPVPRPPQATDPTAAAGRPAAAPAAAGVHVGTLTLTPCKVAARALCGSLTRAWDPDDASQGTLQVGFAFIPAKKAGKPAKGTIVPHEGGPGYSTTASASYYIQTYRPLLRRRNMLLVDQRGTGRSQPLDCPALQSYTGSYLDAVGACGVQVGAHSDDYGSARSADDQAAVIRALGLGKVDVYGDSYGSFFSQAFAGRHPDLVRNLTLDGAYPTYGEQAWYRTMPVTSRHSVRVVCARAPQCARAKLPAPRALREVLAQVRKQPWQGIGYDAEGTRKHVVVDGTTLLDVTYNAGYAPVNYRELAAALRSALAGYRKPLLRLVAENVDVIDESDPADYSEGEYVAVSCQDYPQLFDMAATEEVRKQQLETAIAQQEQTDPKLYAPFTIAEFRASDWSTLDMCLQWPAPAAGNPALPPRPTGGAYHRMPTLVLSGELDTVTTPIEGRMITRQIPGSRQIVVANSFHVTAISDTDDCAVRIARAFVRHPRRTLPQSLVGCAARIPPVRALGRYHSRLANMPRADDLIGTATRRQERAGTTAAATVADAVDRWWNNYYGKGVGLQGGTWKYKGDRKTTFTLQGMQLVKGLAVSGTAVWRRYRHDMTVDLRVRGDVRGHLTGSWDTSAEGARAILTGTLDGTFVALRLPAP